MSVEQLRAIGLPMSSAYAPLESDDGTTRRYVCWTTDEEKATAAEALGATLRPYTSQDARFTGWEVSTNEVVT